MTYSPAHTHGRRYRRLAHKLATYFLLGLGLVIVLTPFLWMLSTSLKSMSEALSVDFSFLPRDVRWENYTEVWRLLPFGRFFLNSFVVSISVTTLQVSLSSMAAYAFARLQWPGRDIVFVVYLSSLMLPMQIAMIPNFFLLRTLGAVDTYLSVILPQSFVVFGTFLLRQFFLSIPRSLQDAALIDGAGHFRIYALIVMPLAKPGLATLGVFSFMFSWNNFLWPLIMLNSQRLFTLPLGLVSFQGQFSTNWPLMMAAACQSMIPVLILYGIAQRHFIEGVTITGLKG
jgi:multiple sugar transport system permease protein